MKRHESRANSPTVEQLKPRAAVVDAQTVRKQFAMRLLPTARPGGTLGEITLLPHQENALHRVRSALQEFHGVLLADDVGLGKTYVALALAGNYQAVHVIAPAALLPMWRDAVRRTAITNAHIHSVHRVSQRADALLQVTASEKVLVIVDEAHHLRTSLTLRYARVAEFVAGHDVLLMSATPLHNRRNELRALLALFLGSRADSLDSASLERVIVRRNHADVDQPGLPRIIELPGATVPFDEFTLNAILALPDPLPAKGGTTAGALIRLGLLRAWCSSDAALAHSIRLRRLRGEALAHALRSGRYPTHDELRTWVVADSSVQLAFPELMVAERTPATPLLRTLEAHLDALAELQLHHAATANSDASRADILRNLLDKEPDRPIVAFSQFTQTVRALHRALSDIAGVASIAGSESRIASGRVSRNDVLWRFAPIAHAKPPPAAHQRVRLLLSTDLLAEGVNLQDAGTVVHLDLPWTDALRKQRVGRCARLGAAFDPIRVLTLEPPSGIDAVLRITRALAHKAGLQRQFVGDGTSSSLSIPEIASQVNVILETWRNTKVGFMHPSGDGQLAMCFVAARRNGWMAVVSNDCGTRLVVHVDGQTTDDIHTVFSVLDSVKDATDIPSHEPAERLVLTVQSQLQQWIDADQARSLVGPRDRAVSAIQRAALTRLSARIAQEPVMRRERLRTAFSVAEELVRSVRGVGAEHGLTEWMKMGEELSLTEWLDCWKAIPSLRQVGLAIARFSPIPLDSRWELASLMVLVATT